MMADPAPKTYTNPVYSGSFSDPFVLKHDDQYFAFCTPATRTMAARSVF
jgi:hypothetical protein